MVQTTALKVGANYNWVNQPERLVYMGTKHYPGDRRTWYQFAKTDKPGVVWSEVLESDLASFEETQPPAPAPARFAEILSDGNYRISSEENADSVIIPLFQWKKITQQDLVGEKVHPSQSFHPDVLKWHTLSSNCYACSGPCNLRGLAIKALSSFKSEEPKLKWPKEQRVGRMGEMAPPGEQQLTVMLDNDSDVIVAVTGKDGSDLLTVSAEFCTTGSGGGKSPKTREALIALMVAIEEDNAATPNRAWPQPR